MSHELSIAYLTGSAKVIRNHLNSDDLIWRKRRTVAQMFFQPYESTEEFIYCARHTFVPMLTLGFAVSNPIGLIAMPIMAGLSAVCAAIGGISTLCGNKSSASFFLNMAEYLIKSLCQSLIDLVLLPISAVSMLTRGVSTGLHAAGILKEPKEERDWIDFKASVAL
jgi:hypothetical protein